MKLLTWLIGLLMMLVRLFIPTGKWQTKRERARQRLKEIDDELIDVSVELVQAKKNHQDAIAVALDMRRERLLKERSDCKRDYDHYDRYCVDSR